MNEMLTATLKAVKLQKTGGERVFCNRQGMPYRSFRTTFERPIRLAGIADLKFHDLRHTFASRLVMVGADVPTVKELLGHQDISLTMRLHISPAVINKPRSKNWKKSQQFS
jgi:site-specific recombinase XerD